MKKRIVYFLLLLFAFLTMAPGKQYAADSNFAISVDTKYTVHESGVTTVAQSIHIKNKTEFYYTPTYTISIGFHDIQNIEAYNSDGTIPTTIDDKNPDNKSIKLTFQKRYTGISNVNTFTLRFDTKDIAKKQGNIWEVTIPGIAKPEDFDEYNSSIVVPQSFGEASIIKPLIGNFSSSSSVVFTKDDIGRAGAYILYGDSQYYSFTITYHISNPNLFPVKTEIALPAQTNYQNVVINSFSQAPLDVTRDRDGNWLAEYKLAPQQKQSVIVKGLVEVVANPKKEVLTQKQTSDYTTQRKYWDSQASSVTLAAKNLATPRDIYRYVVNTLSYNYSKVATDNLRLGGKGALLDPRNSVCLEFTDLFVSLARAKGIPARSVEGYAYTNNTKLRPLSLVNDILHAWPEYYSKEEGKWLMVDPTWGNTTKGMDYFDSLDFAHIAFVVKGMDSEYPIPAGGYKFDKESRDVVVNFADKKLFAPHQAIKITDSFPNFSFPKLVLQGTFTISNSGNAPTVNLIADIATNRGTKRQFLIDYIPPGGSRTITTSFSDVPFLTNGSEVITMHIGNTTYSKNVRISFVPDITQLFFIGGVIIGSIIITVITFHTGSLLAQRRKGKNSLHR